MGPWTRGIATLAALALVPIAALQAYSNVGGTSGWSLSSNGFQLARLARASAIAVSPMQQVQIKATPMAATMARRALALEPLATDALFVLALREAQVGRDERAEALIRNAADLEKRNVYVGMLRLGLAASSGDVSEALRLIDQYARVRPAFAPVLMQTLRGSILAGDNMYEVERALAEEPSWANAFWTVFSRDQAMLPTLVSLRNRTDAGATRDSDQLLLAQLVRAENYSAAFSLWETLSGAHASDTAFVNDTALAPFGWQLTQRGDIHAALTRAGSMEVFVERGASGEVARQLVRLKAGHYRLSADVVGDNPEDIAARLGCVTAPLRDYFKRPLNSAIEWEITGRECPAHWLILEGTAWERRDPLRATLENLRFEPIK